MSKSGSSKQSRIIKHKKRLKILAHEKRVALSEMTQEQIEYKHSRTEKEQLDVMLYDLGINSLAKAKFPELKERIEDRLAAIKNLHYEESRMEAFRVKEIEKLHNAIKTMETRSCQSGQMGGT